MKDWVDGDGEVAIESSFKRLYTHLSIPNSKWEIEIENSIKRLRVYWEIEIESSFERLYTHLSLSTLRKIEIENSFERVYTHLSLSNSKSEKLRLEILLRDWEFY